MYIKDFIKEKISQFNLICESNRVSKIYAFGSSVKESFIPEKSDIDLLVEIDDVDPLSRGNKLIELWNNLEDFFQRKVDLLTPGSVKNPVLMKSIENTKVLIYEQ